MGNCGGRATVSEAEANKRIDDDFKIALKAAKHEIKLLLLGAGESGKSTIFKQLKLIHSTGFTGDEKKRYISTIRSHCVENLCDLVSGAKTHKLLQSQKDLDRVEQVVSRMLQEGLRDDLINVAVELWNSQPLQDAYRVRHLFQLADSAAYFFQSLPRIAAPDFTPTTEDILRCRVRTTGLVEMHFTIDGVAFRLLDVGGQRNERRKWIHCFEGVQAVIFVAAISEYDQVLFEDETSNRLQETLRLFKEICNTRFFLTTTIILFLNKKDLFEEKIQAVDLQVCFPEYEGGCDVDAGIEFLKRRFLAESVSTHQEVFVHTTCATDTSNIRFVFEVVRESVLVENLSSSGFV